MTCEICSDFKGRKSNGHLVAQNVTEETDLACDAFHQAKGMVGCAAPLPLAVVMVAALTLNPLVVECLCKHESPGPPRPRAHLELRLLTLLCFILRLGIPSSVKRVQQVPISCYSMAAFYRTCSRKYQSLSSR